MDQKPIKRFFELIDTWRLYSSSRRLKQYLGFFFQGVDLHGLRVLDIGCGKGLLSLYAACAGARSVTGLEPEAAGSTSGVRQVFSDLVQELGLSNVKLVHLRFQDWVPINDLFDLVILDSSLNHLDEVATANLRTQEEAREEYQQIFRRIFGLMLPGGKIIISEATPYNLFALLGLPNPFVPTVEWKKHQPPNEWANLMCQAGFESVSWQWAPPNRFGELGRRLMNVIAAFLLAGGFRLTARRPDIENVTLNYSPKTGQVPKVDF